MWHLINCHNPRFDGTATAYTRDMKFALLVYGFCGVFANAANVGYSPAYYHPGDGGESVVTLFSLASGKETDVALPKGLATLNLISFGPDGRSVYLQLPSSSSALVKVEFKPLRQRQVHGSAGLGDIFAPTVSPQTGRVFVVASGGWDHPCGAYEIDPDAGTHRPLRVGHGPNCAGANGPISPDGKRMLSSDGKHLNLYDLETGATQSLGEGVGSWSPDGRWIAASEHGRIVLIDASTTSHRKKLGASGVDNHLIWSPDSKRLLFVKQERRCNFLFFAGDDSESLEVVDVETGKRYAVPSAHCAVSSSTVGWIDPEAVQ